MIYVRMKQNSRDHSTVRTVSCDHNFSFPSADRIAYTNDVRSSKCVAIFIAVGDINRICAHRISDAETRHAYAKAISDTEQDISRKKYIYFDDNDNDREDLFRREKTLQKGTQTQAKESAQSEYIYRSEPVFHITLDFGINFFHFRALHIKYRPFG